MLNIPIPKLTKKGTLTHNFCQYAFAQSGKMCHVTKGQREAM